MSYEALIPFLRGGKTEESLKGLNSDFAGNLARFLQDNPYGAGINSGFRSNDEQAKLWANALQKYGSPEAARKWVAPPGSSKHNVGSAVDIGWGSDAATKQKAMEWGHANAQKYGLHFPLKNENWHVEPIGSRDKQAVGGQGAAPSSSQTTPVQTNQTGGLNLAGLFDGKVGTALANTNTTASNPVNLALASQQNQNANLMQMATQAGAGLQANRGEPNQTLTSLIQRNLQNVRLLGGLFSAAQNQPPPTSISGQIGGMFSG